MTLASPEYERWMETARGRHRGGRGVTTPSEVIARRRREQQELLALARNLAEGLAPAIDVRAVVVFGSVARGDFTSTSDVDVLVVADDVPAGASERLRALGPIPPRLEPVVWTPSEWEAFVSRRNPIADEAVRDGIWIQGSPEGLGE